MRKIFFITPPYHCGVVEVAGRWIPLNFAYLASSAIKAGFVPILYDAMSKNKSLKNIEDLIFSIDFDYLALSSITATINENIKISKIAKKIKKNIKVIMGGVHASFMFEEILKENDTIDYIIISEGEETLYELLNNQKDDIKGIAFKRDGRIYKTKAREFLDNLDLYEPYYDFLPWSDYKYFVLNNLRLGAISTSRGCNHNCIFCSQQKFWEKSWRGRSPESVIKDIKKLYNLYGVKVILIADEYPTKDRDRWEEILKMIISLNYEDLYFLMETRADDIIRDKNIMNLYKKANIIHIYLGLEAGTQDKLDLIKKETNVQMGKESLEIIRKYGIVTETSFVLGFPEETKENIKKTVEIAKFYNPDFAHFLFLTPWPYSDLWNEVKPFIANYDYSKYNLVEPVIKPKNLSLFQLEKLVLKCYKDFYFWKFKNLKNEGDFKYNYLIKSFKLMMKSSFIKSKILKYPSFKMEMKNENFKS